MVARLIASRCCGEIFGRECIFKMSEPTTTLHRESTCPVCAYVVNASTAVYTHAKPKSGDLTVCLNCGAFLTYADESLSIRLLSAGEFAALSPIERAQLMRARDAISTVSTVRL